MSKHWNLRETETCEGSVRVREPRVSEAAKTEDIGEEKSTSTSDERFRSPGIDGNRIPLDGS